MRELARKTWLPTLLFALPILVFEMIRGGVSPPPVGTITLVAIIVVPLTWWRMTLGHHPVSPSRGAIGGALCAALIVLLPAAYVVVAGAFKRADHGLGDLTTAAGFIVLACALVILIPAGAALGALAAMLLKRNPAERPS